MVSKTKKQEMKHMFKIVEAKVQLESKAQIGIEEEMI